MKLPHDKTIWGIQGGGLDKQRWQSHLAVGTALRGFYFTFAIRAFGYWARIRLYCRKPFIYLGVGNMRGDLFTERGRIRRRWELGARSQ